MKHPSLSVLDDTEESGVMNTPNNLGLKQKRQHSQRKLLDHCTLEGYKGTTRGWTIAGIERFNQVMIKVARDCQANARLADQNFVQYQRFLHGPREPAVAEEEDTPPQPQQIHIVYNDFDLQQLLMEHAAANNNVNDNENNHDDDEDDEDNDSEDDSEEESAELEPVKFSAL